MGSSSVKSRTSSVEKARILSRVSERVTPKKKIKKAKVRLVVKKTNRKEKSQLLAPHLQDALLLKYRNKARKLGRSILRRWHSRLDLSEVDSIVDLSLCEAVRRYNPTKGASFMTFLFYHLRGNLIRAVSTAVYHNSIPTFDQNESDVVEKGLFKGVSANEVAEALCSSEQEQPEEILLKQELVSMSTSACSKLDPLEREVIERIFLREQQLLDIAKNLGYSRCHISRVKKRALETLQGQLQSSYGEEFRKSEVPDDGEETPVEIKRSKRVRRRRLHHKVLPLDRLAA